MKNISIIWLFVAFITAAMLFIAVGTHPYSYYIWLRWIVFIVAMAGTFRAIYFSYDKDGYGWWALPFLLIAIIFRPIFPRYQKKSTWECFDIISGIIFLIAAIALREKLPKEDK